MKVFLLEDDDAIGMGLKYSLEKEGYTADLYKSKADALGAWKKGEWNTSNCSISSSLLQNRWANKLRQILDIKLL